MRNSIMVTIFYILRHNNLVIFLTLQLLPIVYLNILFLQKQRYLIIGKYTLMVSCGFRWHLGYIHNRCMLEKRISTSWWWTDCAFLLILSLWRLGGPGTQPLLNPRRSANLWQIWYVGTMIKLQKPNPLPDNSAIGFRIAVCRKGHCSDEKLLLEQARYINPSSV